MIRARQTSFSSRAVVHLVVACCWLFAWGGQPVLAQPRLVLPSAAAYAGTPAPSLDAQLFYEVYHIQNAAFAGYMRGVNAAAYPVFIGAPLAAWGSDWLLHDGRSWEDAYRLTLSEVAAAVVAISLKAIVRRPRPYTTLADVEPRVSRLPDPYSFPSGHATLAFAIATSWSLSHPEWYGVIPAAAWASSVALSRVWLGVHYPSDVFAGALIGTTVGVVVHLLGPRITPGFLRDAGS